MRNWERRHRITELLREALRLAQEESAADGEDWHANALTVRLGLLYDDSCELEEKALERHKAHTRDRSSE